MVRNGVAFLKHPSVASVTWAERVTFLRSKGLTDDEITAAQAQAYVQDGVGASTGVGTGLAGLGPSLNPTQSGTLSGTDARAPHHPEPPSTLTTAMQWLAAAAAGAGAYHVLGGSVGAWLSPSAPPAPPLPDPALTSANAALEEAAAANRCRHVVTGIAVCVLLLLHLCAASK